MDDKQRQRAAEHAIIRAAVAALAKLCAGDERKIVEMLEGYLWDEEEASGIKEGMAEPGRSPACDATEGYEVEKGDVATVMVKFKDGAEQKDVSVTEWINGDGFDIGIDSGRIVSVSAAEAAALKFALTQLDL